MRPSRSSADLAKAFRQLIELARENRSNIAIDQGELRLAEALEAWGFAIAKQVATEMKEG